MKPIVIRKAFANNLKNVDVAVDFGRMTVLAGPSGSGKSSLAFDVLAAAAAGNEVKASVSGLPRATVGVTQKIASPSRRIAELRRKIKSLPQKSLVIVDEPCAGLTEKEAKQLAAELLALARKGHAVVAVDHRAELIGRADRVFAFGPGAGAEGGRIVADMPGKAYLKTLKTPPVARMPNRARMTLSARFETFGGIAGYELSVPLLRLAGVTGPMGCGKSTLLDAVFTVCDKSAGAGPRRRGLLWAKGKQHVRRPHLVTSDPVAKNARSVVATYFGVSGFLKGRRADMTVAEALKRYASDRLLARRLALLDKVGLAYLRLDQPSHTLSGGECQRVKLAKMLTKKLGDRSLYIFDNPCRGLGTADVARIMTAFDGLVKGNNTVLIAENDPLALKYVDATVALRTPNTPRENATYARAADIYSKLKIR